MALVYFVVLTPISIIVRIFGKDLLGLKFLKESLIKNTLILLLIYLFLRLIFEFEHGWGENVRRSVLFRLDSIAYGFLAYLIKDQIGKKSIHYAKNGVTDVMVTIKIRNTKTYGWEIGYTNLKNVANKEYKKAAPVPKVTKLFRSDVPPLKALNAPI